VLLERRGVSRPVASFMAATLGASPIGGKIRNAGFRTIQA